MKEFESIEDVLEFAIEREQEAADFYNNLAKNASDKVMRDTFEQYAKEEMGHKARLQKIKDGGTYTLKQGDTMDLKIGDYLVGGKVSENMSYQDALILAMKREKSAYKLYMKLSEKAPSLELEILFRDLANEEAKHKLRFETEYDDIVLRDN